MSSEQGLWHLRFSSREVGVLLLLLEGKTGKEIARSLQISCRAVEFHLHTIREKLSVRKNIEQLHEGLTEDRTAIPTNL